MAEHSLKCFDCRAPHHYQVVLINKLWERVGVGPSYRQKPSGGFNPDALLCFTCIEKRLKRKLRISDLMICPVNAPWVLRIWMRRFPKHWSTPDDAMRNVDYEKLINLFAPRR